MKMKNYIENEIKKKRKFFSESYAQMVSEFNSEQKTTKDYNGRQLLELIQNADDAHSRTVLIKIDKKNPALITKIKEVVKPDFEEFF
ncbi:hypothetical protein IH824_19785 [candidate division KSB1 bacterium]|nr:hypothetical protein [candidate division KSB1 bacterium]